MHVAVGYAIAGLVAARIVWGFIGARHACFSDFVCETLRRRARTRASSSSIANGLVR